MAGPGGGPPRRSHTKSRKGCDNCRNCTKHKVRCPYNDVPVPDERSATPDKPDLMWTPEVEATIEQWQRTGIFPFPNLGIFPAPAPQYYSLEDLRLILHVASICNEMNAIDANGFTLWTRQIPTILKIGAAHAYVMHALLAFSAMHIAFLTDCPLVGNMAYEHRGIALKGLQEAIGTFSRETSDAVLAASLVLSWQATDWRSWTQLMQGTSTVIDAMEPWKHESQFGEFIAESSTFPTAPPSPTPDHKPNQPHKEDLEAFQRTINQLSKVEAHLKQNKEDTKLIQQLTSFMKGARKITPIQSISDQFDRLQPLRTWLFWLPVMCLKQNGASPSALIVIAHYYTAAILMERLFPEIGAAYFGSLSIGPVEEIARRLLSINVSGSLEGDVQTPLTLMEFPIDTVNEFRSRMGWLQPARTPSFPQFDPPNFYMSENVQQDTPPPTTSYLPYGDNPPFSWSTEDLSMLAPEQEQGSAVSPLNLSSPFAGQQYLNIPSPSYGAYSPASSTFGEGSIAYSDHDEFVPYDAGVTGYPPMGSAEHSNFGVGTNSAQNPAVISSGYPPLEVPMLQNRGGPSNLQYDACRRAPSPFLSPGQAYGGSFEPTAPLSASAPSPAFMPPPHMYRSHHRHHSSVASAPVPGQTDDSEL
ncbi:hypothetical protein DL764_002751 [Monosporascus ibericus]|uniref:Zn(2)-C6 fungal-type domain-containing protein n=1 Tax=Monosporascus ibericus TaxID=155417 RepID=A0A4Q4TNC3_9PEZI|nr:hypothetical protein DL764_002751 [Monosporascus ibericus]